MMARKPKAKAEFGDFQTPDDLAGAAVRTLAVLSLRPRTIIEPCCGVGAFLAAARDTFPAARLFGLDVNKAYVDRARTRLGSAAVVETGNFFSYDWSTLLASAEEPILILGNPPWVTNAKLGSIGSANLPEKTNFQNMKGFDALTGKSNFDISEWMLIQHLRWLAGRRGAIAVLCKVSVARKVLSFAWKNGMRIAHARAYLIDAMLHFSASVDACFLVVNVSPKGRALQCDVYPSLDATSPSSRFGIADGILVSDIPTYRKYSALRGTSPYTWRSGIKHDCSKVMELRWGGTGWVNGYGEQVDIEDDYVFPLFKSSDVSGSEKNRPRKAVIVPQRQIAEDTADIERAAPRTWEYLCKHGEALDARSSVIYRDKPRFSVFGIGEYSFAPWKVAISGLYKNLHFRMYGPVDGKPVFFDDTVYFLSFDTEEEARAVHGLLETETAQQAYGSMIFWDEKRPVTAEILRRIDLTKLAAFLGASFPATPEGSGLTTHHNRPKALNFCEESDRARYAKRFPYELHDR